MDNFAPSIHTLHHRLTLDDLARNFSSANIYPIPLDDPRFVQSDLIGRENSAHSPDADARHYLSRFGVVGEEISRVERVRRVLSSFTYDSKWKKAMRRISSHRRYLEGTIINVGPDTSIRRFRMCPWADFPYNLSLYKEDDKMSSAAFSVSPASLFILALHEETPQNYTAHLLDHIAKIAKTLDVRSVYIERSLVGVDPRDQAGRRYLALVEGGKPQEPRPAYGIPAAFSIR